MPAKSATIPVAPRKSLLEWIEHDGDQTDFTKPVCSDQDKALYARILVPNEGRAHEPLQPPHGLALAPLG